MANQPSLNTNIISGSSSDPANSEEFSKLSHTTQMNRSGVYDCTKTSYINKMSNFLKWVKLNPSYNNTITIETISKLNDTLFKISNTSDPKNEHLHFDRFGSKSNKLEKYNLDFGTPKIHNYFSIIEEAEYPIHISLDYVDIFFGLLKSEITKRLLKEIEEFCVKNNLAYTPEEKSAIEAGVIDYIDPFRFDKVWELHLKKKLKYSDFEKQKKWSDNPDEYQVTSDNFTGPNFISTGIFGQHTHMNESVTFCAQEAYNNWVYRLYNCDKTIFDPSREFSHINPSYLNGDGKNVTAHYTKLNLDWDNLHAIPSYDANHTLFLDRSSNFNLEEYHNIIGAITENGPSLLDELLHPSLGGANAVPIGLNEDLSGTSQDSSANFQDS